MTAVDYVEVGRKAHEMITSHGRKVRLYATKLATAARDEGQLEEAAFWRAVELSITPRGDTSKKQFHNAEKS
jgi:hypothetical protein